MYFYMWINHYFLILSYTRAFIGCSSLFTVHVQGLVHKAILLHPPLSRPL